MVVVEEPSKIEEPTESVESPVAETEDETYDSIILVPAEPEAPVESETPVASEDVIEIVPVEIPEEQQDSVEQSIPLTTEGLDISNYVVESEDLLTKDCYYIQIATLSNVKNIENNIRKYSKYPIVLIPAGKSYRMLIGPLSVDEYGAALVKFKDAGFKDAFVRKK